MNPVHPWLDADEVRRMAEQLMRPAPKKTGTLPPDAGFGVEFVGFTPTPGALPTAGPRPVGPAPFQLVAEPPAPPPGPPTIVATPPAAPPAPVPAINSPSFDDAGPVVKPSVSPPVAGPSGPFLERIRQFRDWMGRQFGARGLFILDREGSVIFDEGTHGRLHFLARSLALASRRPGSGATNVHVKIGVGSTLEVIPVDTPFGCLVVGAAVPAALDQESVGLIMRTLAAAATPPAADRSVAE